MSAEHMRSAPARTGLPLPVALLVAAAGGVTFMLAFPAHDLWYLAPVALGALFASLRGRLMRSGFLVGLVFGLAFFVPFLQWVRIYVGSLPWIALAVVEALYLGVLGLVTARTLSWLGGGPLGAVAFSAQWVAMEWVRSHWPFGGFPWGLTAFSQSTAPSLHVAGIGGTALMGFVVALAGALAASGVWLLLGRVHRIRGAIGLGTATALFLLPALIPLPSGDDSPTLRVAGIQGNVTENGLQMGNHPREVLENHARLTHELGDQLRADGDSIDLLVWPENASDIDPLADDAAYRTIDEAVSAVDADAMIGAVRYEPEPYRWNTSFFWQPGLGPTDTYVKQRPVPFAEYIPYRSFFRQFTDLVDLVSVDMASGMEPGVFDVGGVGIGDLICFEIAYEDTVQQTVRSGADVLVVQTNNATFGDTPESVQQLAESRVFAVVTGKSVVHISTVGVSAYYGPDGTQLAYGAHWEPSTLLADVPVRTEETLAVRSRQWWYAGAGIVAGAAFLVALAHRTRKRTTTPAVAVTEAAEDDA